MRLSELAPTDLLERLARDIDRAPIPLAVEFEGEEEEPRLRIRVRGADSDATILLTSAATLEDVLELMMSAVQDLVLDQLWGEPWPACPVHPTHPLSTTTSNGWAEWRCPADPTIAFPIGLLPAV